MKKHNIKFFVILMGSIFATGLQAMTPQPQSLAAYITSFFYNPKNVQQLLDVFIPRSDVVLFGLHIKKSFASLRVNTALFEEAIAIRDMLLDKYKCDELPSIGNVKHAHVTSIGIHLIDPNGFNERYEFNARLARLKFNNHYDPLAEGTHEYDFIHDKLKNKYYSAEKIKIGVELIENGKAAGIATNSVTSYPVVLLDNELSMESANSVFIIFHELAHAFDAGLRESYACPDISVYTWLKDDIEGYNLQEARLCEWHADKQAISWMKKYKPELIKKLIEYYGHPCWLKNPYPRGLVYPPASVMLAWLRDPNV